MNTKLKLIFTLFTMTLAGHAFAASVPPPVTGVVAQTIDGQIVAQWDAIESEIIDYYRVYYSTESILENNGIYDDFEVTEGNLTTLSFIPPSDTQDVYIAVIAVKANGTESPYFTNEAYVKIPAGPAVLKPEDEPPPPEVINPDVPAHTTLKLLNATVITPEEISVEFSTSVIVDPDRAPTALTITKSDGVRLNIAGITIDGKTITIRTETQERGVVYNVEFSEPFSGRNGQTLDANSRSVLVKGHNSGKDPVEAPRVSDPHNPPDVEDATLTPTLQKNKNYTVTIEWTVDNTPKDIWKIVVYQTRDGRTFGPPTLLPVDIAGVQLKNVTPGFYGLYIQTINTFGRVSHGVFQYTTLPSAVDLKGDVVGITAEETLGSAPAGVMAMAVMTEDTKTTEMDFDIPELKNASPEQPVGWIGAAIVAGSIAVTMILLVSIFVMFTKKNGSAEW